jgi:Phytochelatin synthase
MQWDDWKFHAAKQVENLPYDPNDALILNLWGQTSLGRSRLESWWDTTSKESGDFVKNAVNNAERFGEHAKSWWQAAESEGRRSISGFSLGEKEAALDHTFRGWWQGASQAERAWWNSTVLQLRHDRQIGTEWVDAVKQKDSSMLEQGREWVESAKAAIGREETAVADEDHRLWNESRQFAQKEESALTNKLALWWQITKSVAQRGLNATTEKEEEWWNATEHWFSDHVRSGQQEEVRQIARPLLYLNSTTAYSLLMNGYHWMDYSNDFFLLQSGFDAQINQAYCAVASSAAILNSLRFELDLPIDPVYHPYPYATQLALLDNSCVQDTVIYSNATFDGLLHAPGGLSLAQAKGLLECTVSKSWNVSARYADPERMTVDDVRRELAEALKDPSKRVIVNFDRRGIGQEGGGHFSPLGSYNKQQDAFLMMDVAKYRYISSWVPTELLYSAMASIDSCGEWDYPDAHFKLRNIYRNISTAVEYERAMKKLGCQARYRGYIIVG